MASTSLILPFSSAFSINVFKNHHQTIGKTQMQNGLKRKWGLRLWAQENLMRTTEDADGYKTTKRRDLLMGLGFCGVSSFLVGSCYAEAAGLPPEEKPKLCDAECEKELENVPMVTTESGLQYKDIKVGRGPNPPVGFQVAANYVAMVPSGQIFDSSLEKGRPYIFRVGAEQVIKGLDEGILSMKVGGLRRLYVPGSLAFPKGLTSAPGRPRVAPNSPVVFDVSLEYIPGLESDEE
ncbi:Peptidyl-prolyl cis-trans isomerase FKBP16-3, chloroplastic [Capsicum chinense]|uniref:peptidylprolyl isomerase n=1 Tax=Capsicum annuum TaxID=4072 RepID=A0A2G2XYE0_CAPAN|nr:peptidyl-prolyl cis-trans isomerase FKBP16-3, chloroplastic [Capsicum annuum]KAF3628424.1 Peptidyl-prolyl cis-trans isomerase FKBP16-3, chloroplastic [Capsicum annuum]PHT62528.1 Peptidyl-prolyl cis-trans isomerase FKBP16-3, chloroplastic [Capsicum annuum]PHU16822.1 Peptidyl-prolyl cis-trans isomerase FKBP16-3, chloroplastic [Capsicum chinense]